MNAIDYQPRLELALAAAREAAKSYSESFARTQDALGKLVHEAAGWLGSVKGWIDDKLR